jgi:hypothetical protein
MKSGFTPWSEVMLEDALRCERAACFALGCLEREHRLNVDALVAYWVRASLAWWAPLLPRLDQPGTRTAAATSSPPSPRAMP